MVQNLFKAFLVSLACTLLLGVRVFTMGDAQVFAQGTPTPFLPSATFTPGPEPKIGETILVRVTHYWPPLGGINCSHYENGQCVSKMASGEAWQDWEGLAIACPPELAFGTQILIGDRIWICLDRGGAIQIEDGAYRVDMLIPEPLDGYEGEVVEATILPEQFVLNGTE